MLKIEYRLYDLSYYVQDYGDHIAHDLGVSLTWNERSLILFPYAVFMCGLTCSNAHLARFSAVGTNGTSNVFCPLIIESAFIASMSPS